MLFGEINIDIIVSPQAGKQELGARTKISLSLAILTLKKKARQNEKQTAFAKAIAVAK
jgi:hypothetical protein